jgi:hypothetical protein
MNNWNYNIDEAPEDKTLWLTLENEDGCLKVIKSEICFRKTEGLKIRAWKPTESKPAPAEPPPKPKQLAPNVWCGGITPLIAAVEQRTREIVDWEQKYEVKK